jgi:hypothetical protein
LTKRPSTTQPLNRTNAQTTDLRVPDVSVCRRHQVVVAPLSVLALLLLTLGLPVDELQPWRVRVGGRGTKGFGVGRGMHTGRAAG